MKKYRIVVPTVTFYEVFTYAENEDEAFDNVIEREYLQVNELEDPLWKKVWDFEKLTGVHFSKASDIKEVYNGEYE